MSHTITISLSEKAQRAAILAGEPAQAEQTYDVPQELVQRLLALPWTKVTKDGSAVCEVADLEYTTLDEPVTFERSGRGTYGRYRYQIDARPADAEAAVAVAEDIVRAATEQVRELRRENSKRQAEIQAEREAEREAAERWARRPLLERATHDEVRFYGLDRHSVDRYAPDALAEAERERDRLRDEQKQREAAAEEAERAKLYAWVELAAAERRPELARAATEGRHLGEAPTELLREIVAERVREVVGEAPVASTVYQIEERTGVPSAEAYRIFDALKAAEQLGEGLPFAIEVSEISRIDIAPQGSAVWRTGVVVDCGPVQLAAFAEPLDEDDE